MPAMCGAFSNKRRRLSWPNREFGSGRDLLPDLEDGESTEMQGSGAKPYVPEEHRGRLFQEDPLV